MEWFVEPFSYDFMQRALAAGLLAAVATSVVGVWVVIRGMAFLGDALAHGVLPGIALAFLWGLDITVGALVSALVMIFLLGVVTSRPRVGTDTGIGLLFVGMLALGVIIISRAGSYAGDLTSFLFGSPLAVTSGDLLFQAVVAGIVVIGATVLHRPLLALAFNSDKATLLGLRPGLTHAALLTMVALVVVGSFRAVGTMLVFGLLVAPAATAALVARRVLTMMLTAVAVGAVSVYLGLLLSYHLDLAAGATMAGTAVLIFFLALTARELLGQLGTRSAAAVG